MLRKSWSRLPKTALLAALGVTATALVLLIIYWRFQTPTREWNSIGDASDADWDIDRCSSTERFARFNGAGDVAALRESTCDWGFGIDTQRYYLFVRRIGKRDTHSNLVFRVEVINESTPPPVVKWVSRRLLTVSYAGAVSPISMQVDQLDGITINFEPTQPYAGFVLDTRSIVFAPDWHRLALMTFDLLPLPDALPSEPLAATGDFSRFGCDDEFLAISKPIKEALQHFIREIEDSRAASGRPAARSRGRGRG